MTDLDWRTLAVCKDDPERQFPGWNAEGIQLAKRVCMRCDVRQECLDWANDHGENEGIWGGLTPAERAAGKAAPVYVTRPRRRSGVKP